MALSINTKSADFARESSFLPLISKEMTSFSNQGKADIHFKYGTADKNALETNNVQETGFSPQSKSALWRFTA